MDDLKNLVEYMASRLVADPTQLNIVTTQYEQTIHIELTVPADDMGKVIGRQGRIARSMRTLLTIAASRRNLRGSLDINEA